MKPRNTILLVAVAIALIIIVPTIFHCIGYNSTGNWQVIQPVSGEPIIQESSGYYWQGFATVYTFPRSYEIIYNDDKGDGDEDIEAVRVTFNDGGTAQVSTLIRFNTPVEKEKQLAFNRTFQGEISKVKNSVKSHLINCLKATAPIMSASENQLSRKSEFASVVEEMLKHGRFKMKRIKKFDKEILDENGKPVEISVTEITLNEEGQPIIPQPSPFIEYGIEVVQFSVTDIDYDKETRAQFSAKKKALLETELAKADRLKEKENRLMIVEKGLREKAEATAAANVAKATAVIAAELKAEVALQEKLEQETVAAMKLAVAKITKETAATAAEQKLEVAKLNRQAAEEEAKEMIVLANAEEERIQKAGAITEEAKILAEIARDRDISVAKELAKIRVPAMVFSGGGNTGDSGSVKDQLMNMYLLEKMKLLPADIIPVAGIAESD